MISLITDISESDTPLMPMSDRGIVRCPEILAFHAALDRRLAKSHEFSGETHPFYELVYVVDGKVGITAGEEIYTLESGQFLLHPPGEFHRLWSGGGTEPRVLNLSFHAAAMPVQTGRVIRTDGESGDGLCDINAAIAAGLRDSDREGLNEQRMLLELWLLRTMRNAACGAGRSVSSSALRYTEIVNVLRHHIGESLSAQEIAVLCNMSLSSLKKIFSRYAGMGVSRYFTDMKMRRAAELLRSGKRVGETASELGFTDQNYFSTVFRRVMGATPGSYRN